MLNGVRRVPKVVPPYSAITFVRRDNRVIPRQSLFTDRTKRPTLFYHLPYWPNLFTHFHTSQPGRINQVNAYNTGSNSRRMALSFCSVGRIASPLPHHQIFRIIWPWQHYIQARCMVVYVAHVLSHLLCVAIRGAGHFNYLFLQGVGLLCHPC